VLPLLAVTVSAAAVAPERGRFERRR